MLSIGPNTWNTTITDIVGDMVTADIRVKWCNYHAGGGLWLPIQSRWDEGTNGEYEHTASNWSLIAPALATGRITTYQENDYDIFGGGLFTLNRTPALELEHVGALPVEAVYDPARPYEVRYPSAFGAGASLLLRTWHARAMRPEHLVEITALPENGSDCEIVARVYTSMCIPRWNGEAIDIGATGAGMLVGTYSYGMGMRPAVAWYRDAQGELVTQPISVIATRHTGYVELRKIVPRLFIEQGLAAGALAIYADETLTVNPDPDAETNSCDGSVTRTGTNVTYSTLTNSATGSSFTDTSTTLTCADLQSSNTSSRYNSLTRGIVGFYVSLAGATVSSAKVGVTGTVKSNSFPSMVPSVCLTSCSPASSTGLTANDFGTFVKTLKSDTILYYSKSPLWSGSAVNEFPLNAAAVAALNLAGVNFFGLMDGGDVSGGAPGQWSTIKQFTLAAASAETTGTGSDPYLTITYTAGGSTTADRSYPRGVGRGIMRGCA